MEKQEAERDYLYINMWSLLMLVGVAIFGVVFLVPQLIDIETELILCLLCLTFMGGSLICIQFALKKNAKQSRILAFYIFLLSLISVTIGIIAVYDGKKLIVVLSLLLSIPISFFSLLPTFYYGDEKK